MKTTSYIFLAIGTVVAKMLLFTHWKSTMKRLSKDLKRMLAGLAYQDAGDYLSTPQKSRLLGYADEREPAARMQPPVEAPQPAQRCIALVSDGRGEGAPLDYAIEAAQRQRAGIDLLLHDRADERRTANLERRLKQAGIPYRCVRLVEPVLDDLRDYILQHASLIFLVAMPDDEVVRVIVEEVIPKRLEPIAVPLVLIEAQQPPRSLKQSAA